MPRAMALELLAVKLWRLLQPFSLGLAARKKRSRCAKGIFRSMEIFVLIGQPFSSSNVGMLDRYRRCGALATEGTPQSGVKISGKITHNKTACKYLW